MVECFDTGHGLKFTQVWRNNMHNAEEPVVDTISSSEKKRGDYVKITFVVSNNKCSTTVKESRLSLFVTCSLTFLFKARF